MEKTTFNLGGLEKALKSVGIEHALVEEKSAPGIFHGRPYIQLTIEDVQPVSDITMTGNIVKAARELLGYGASSSNYDPDSKVLIVGYQPIKKEEPKKKEVPGCDLRH